MRSPNEFRWIDENNEAHWMSKRLSKIWDSGTVAFKSYQMSWIICLVVYVLSLVICYKIWMDAVLFQLLMVYLPLFVVNTHETYSLSNNLYAVTNASFVVLFYFSLVHWFYCLYDLDVISLLLFFPVFTEHISIYLCWLLCFTHQTIQWLPKKCDKVWLI